MATTSSSPTRAFDARSPIRIALFYGAAYTATSVLFFPQVWWGNLSPARFTLMLVHTCGVYACLFLLPAILLQMLVGLLRVPRPRLVLHATFFFVLTVTAANLLWNMRQPSEVPIGDASRFRFGLYSLAVGVLASGLASPLLAALCHPVFAERLRMQWRWPVRIVAVAVLAAAFIPFGGSGDSLSSSTAPTYLIGLDGATWKVLTPLLRNGDLPNFARLLRESAYGTLLTYGKPYSPPVWTTIATGKTPEKHGIYSHVIHQPGEIQPVLVGSNQRRAAALWNIASEYGRRVLNINYYVADPPEPVNGINVTRPGATGLFNVAPAELTPSLQSLNAEHDWLSSDHAVAALADLRAVDELFATFKSRGPFDLTMLYSHSTDDIQHRFWHAQEPDYYRDAPGWEALQDSVRTQGVNPVSTHWRAVDGFIGHVLDAADGANVVVVSDHGFRPLPYPYTAVRINNLLADLGLLHFGADGHIDFASTSAYSAGSDGSYPEICVNLNVAGREPHGTVPESETTTWKARVAEQLRRISLDGGGSLFPEVLVNSDHAFPEQFASCDVLVGITSEARRPSSRLVRVGTVAKPYTDYLDITRTLTGTHDNLGIIVVRAAGLRAGPWLFAHTLDTPLSLGLAFLNGRSAQLDPIMHAAQWIGLLPAVSTLDIAPSVLGLMGLPAAADMDGRTAFNAPGRPAMVASYDYLMHREVEMAEDEAAKSGVGLQPVRAREPQGAVADESARERLRSLGYLQ